MNSDIYIWGLGHFFQENREQISKEYNIIGYIDTYKSGKNGDKNIINLENLDQLKEDAVILIMIKDIKICMEISRQLLDKEISADRISIGIFEYDKGFPFLGGKVLNNGRIVIFTEFGEISIGSVAEWNTLISTFVRKEYDYHIYNHKKDIVIDIGMNIGDTALYFLSSGKTEKLYGFEPFTNIYEEAKRNIKRNNIACNRYEITCCGLGNYNGVQNCNYNQEISIGLSTNDEAFDIANNYYKNCGYITKDIEPEQVKVEIKCAADILRDIIQKHQNNNIVIKMDCEGSEYEILENISENNLLEEIDFIMLEWHYRGKEKILDCFAKHNFGVWNEIIREDMGMIYAWNMRK